MHVRAGACATTWPQSCVVQPAVGVLRVLADDKRTAALVGHTPGLPAMPDCVLQSTLLCCLGCHAAFRTAWP